VATIDELRERSVEMFGRLLNAQVAPPGGARRGLAAMARDTEPFSWFDPEQAVGAAALAFRLSARAASRDRPEDALELVLDDAEEEARRAHPEAVRQGLAMFVTHNREGRRLLKPRTASAAPDLFDPPAPGPRRQRISIGGRSPGLDYWREDVLANEHHQHWHEVYPFTGLPPRDFDEWLRERTPEELVSILDAIQPDPGWAEFVEESTPQRLAEIFGQVVQLDQVFGLPPELYSLLFRLNDRQGELFFYMHQQMLARYDAELLSNGLARVEPFGEDDWDDPIEAGHDPVGLPPFGRREENRTLPSEARGELEAMLKEVRDALAHQDGLKRAGGGRVAIDRTNLGEAVEGTVAQLSGLDPEAYPGLHNIGHGLISGLSAPPPGVMASTVTAIRDQVFWQWHKFVDDQCFAWQEKLGHYEYDDAPEVAMGDIVVMRASELPDGEDPEAAGERLFGGDSWDSEPPEAELITAMDTASFGGGTIQFLTHEPFSYFFRIENLSSEPRAVTVRVFMAPAEHAADRRAWMEMDKFPVTLPASSKVVVHRPDTESSVVKRPAETSPLALLQGGGDPDENAYCDCGWPYTLLLPRGTAQGMDFRLMAICTDAQADGLATPAHCGSISYCGAVDRYPDSRDMGYPFSRRFESAIQDTIDGLPSASARTITIRHV
jgi:Hemocyanin, ig-like domain/Hemocyanin, copper containing domain